MNLLIYIISFFSLFACNQTQMRQNIENNGVNKTNNEINKKVKSSGTLKNVPEGLKKLLKAYPDFLESADENTLYWKDGTIMQWDDGITGKTHDEMLDNPDLEDMMSQKYVKGSDWSQPPAEDFEPGRVRYEPFFTKMYGSIRRSAE